MKASPAAVAVLFLACGASAVTIHVNPNNVSGTTNGLTFATGWTTIGDAVTDLGLTNAPPNQGGHTVLVGAGTYDEQVSLDASHSGSNGAPNAIRAGGPVTIDRNQSLFGGGDAFFINGAV